MCLALVGENAGVDERWLTAARGGDRDTVLDLLRALPAVVVAGQGGSLLLQAAAYARQTEVVALLVEHGADAARPWADGTDPVTWAADHGSYEVLQALLASSKEPFRQDSPQHRALAAARPWLTVDPERELRGRLGIGRHGEARVERELVGGIDFQPTATLLRVTTPDGRCAEVELAHRAVVTFLERAVGQRPSRHDLVARALHFGEPGSCDWSESLDAMTARLDLAPTYTWAAGAIEDPSTDLRRFAADVLHAMSFEDRPFRARALELLRRRLRAEGDPAALDSALGAFAGYSRAEADLADIVQHARHPAAEVRLRVALLGSVGNPQYGRRFAPPPEVPVALVELTYDPEGLVRAGALFTLAEGGMDEPHVRAAMADRLHDEDDEARLQAAAGLALLGDPRGSDVFGQIAGTVEAGTPAALRVDEVSRRLAHGGPAALLRAATARVPRR
ncbi:MAG: hypothetical protein QOH97_5244 [Actinoplanes sp.]|jgi:hypothetical protein|nr:hypothetical protein [Actinoplanes sp.]